MHDGDDGSRQTSGVTGATDRFRLPTLCRGQERHQAMTDRLAVTKPWRQIHESNHVQ